MKLLQVTILCLLVSSILHTSEGDGEQIKTTPPLNTSVLSAAKTPVPGTLMTSSPDAVTTPAVGTSPRGTTTRGSLQTSLPPITSLTTTVKGKGATTNDVTKTHFTTASIIVRNVSLPSVVSTLQSSQHKTENLSSINATQIPVSSIQPNASTSNTSLLSSISTTIPENISPSQGTENEKKESSSSTNPSHSSTPENGNDQPQSDKESVKLLTVKTISHESGEHSAQGKTKN
ncbi:endomucin isoform X2 [Pteronotus mesoamericanus]|uniref:endomucin isoform X2 n=1 Tax=Pteronotus mesoamericanus TaxID=1884717 RepID=UPI0023ED990B|nr:endomucin isoform X2 [Pteronotus parnellii mesoamericanus]